MNLRFQEFIKQFLFGRYPIGSGFPLYLSCAQLVSVSHQVFSTYFKLVSIQNYS